MLAGIVAPIILTLHNSTEFICVLYICVELMIRSTGGLIRVAILQG